MLANPISLNKWSLKALIRTLNLNLLHGQYNCIVKLPYKQNLIKTIKRTRMSEKNSKSNLIETPSTSASCSRSSNRKCSKIEKSLEKSSCRQHSKENGGGNGEQSISNVIMNPAMFMHTGIPNISNEVHYQSNQSMNVNYNEYSETFSQHYYHRYQIEAGLASNTHMRRNRGQELLSLRTMENTTNGKHSNRPSFIFTLMCYNILAQDLVNQHPYLYAKHNPGHLTWKMRWDNLYKEIKATNPDILCLQEVQESHIQEYFSKLESLGYRGLYKKRTGQRTDGCALYFKWQQLHLVEYTTVEFYQPHVSLLTKDNVAIVAKLVPRIHPTREFVVTTTHLLFNRRRQDIRLAQMQILLTEVERISYRKDIEDNCEYLPVIITGDLNSKPDSAVYEFITRGKLDYENLSPRVLLRDTHMNTGKVLVTPDLRITDNCQHADLLEKRKKNANTTRTEEMSIIKLTRSEDNAVKVAEQKQIDLNLFCTGTLSHNFEFKSVYNHGSPHNREGTTYHDEWVTVDYIFYSVKKNDGCEDKLKLLARHRLPTKNELKGLRIPNSVLGSDHLSLLAKFKLEL